MNSAKRGVFVALLLCVVQFVYGKDKPLPGVTFTPFSSDNPVNSCLTMEKLRESLELIKTMTDNLRIYTISQCPQNTRAILEFARENNMKVLMGMWISRNFVVNDNEFYWLDDFATEFKDVISAVVVGNEAVSVQKVVMEDLLAAVQRARDILAKNGVDLPVTTAEIWPLFDNKGAGQRIADVSDFICLQVQPFWEGRPPKCGPDSAPDCMNAGTYANYRADLIQAEYKKEVWLCESGWPTKGERCCGERPYALTGFQAVPSTENANQFLKDVVKATKASGRPFYYHEAIDAEWKRRWSPCGECVGLFKEDFGCGVSEQCELDYHWGVHTYDLKRKSGIKLPK